LKWRAVVLYAFQKRKDRSVYSETGRGFLLTEEPMGEWFENEAFWREGYRFMFSDDAFRAATNQVEQVISLTGVGAGRVLDLGVWARTCPWRSKASR
jgi:hypothetical protein